MGIAKRFKNYFFRGLAVLLPTILTIWIFVWGYKFIQENISIHINRGLVWLTMFLNGEDWNNIPVRQGWNNFWIDGWGSIAGFIVALVLVCIIGALLASVVGRSLWKMVERLIMNVPFLRRVYPYIKQVTDFLLTQPEKQKMFSRVVAVEYPRNGIWSLGLVTGEGIEKLKNTTGKEFLNILIPTSPTPFTGFVIMVPKNEVVEMDITIEQALRFVVSAGVIKPGAMLEGEEFLSLTGNS